MIDREPRIVHETANLYAYRLDSGRISLRLHNGTHSIVVGERPDLDSARRTMERLERYPAQLREFHGAFPARPTPANSQNPI